MKKYIEKAIEKGLTLNEEKVKYAYYKENDFYEIRNEKDYVICGRHKENYILIKSVFKSLFGEEKGSIIAIGKTGETCHEEIGKDYHYHLQQWIISDLTPEQYLDKHYKE